MGMQRILLLAVFSTMLLSCHAGPAGQIALAAARASKIPRSIRASFRNPEIGVARGFGKRASSSSFVGGATNFKESKFFNSHNLGSRINDERIRKGRSSGIRFKLSNGELRIGRGFGKRSATNEVPWSYRKDDSKLFEEVEQERDPLQQLTRESLQEGLPIDWLANEMANNPYLARLILHRIVDINKDGLLSAGELAVSDFSDSY